MTSAGEALQRGAASLKESSGTSRSDALLLLAHVLQCKRERIIAHPETLLSEEQAGTFIASCERRASGMPIAYILGSAGFYGRDFIVSEHVLIPRAETEHVVEEAIQFIQARMHHERGVPRVLEIGVGCGAIACTIAAESGAWVDGTDTSRNALVIATKNARRIGVMDRCAFYHGDLAEPVRRQRFDVVIANLPYVPTGDVPQSPDPVSFEPRNALDGGPDGLALYRRLLPDLPDLLNPEGLLLFEAAPPTIQALKQLVQAAFPHSAISVGDDYAGLARYIKAHA